MHAVPSAGVAAGLVLAVLGTQATTLGLPPRGDLSSPNGIGAKLEPNAGDTPIVAVASAVEAINAVVILDPPWEAFYLNLYDPSHPKDLRFQGRAVFGEGPHQPSTSMLWVQFDWLDPSWGVIYSPAWGFPISWGTSAVVDASWTIAFCPEQVSLHLATDTPTGGSVNVAGQFTHECRLAPPPGGPAAVPRRQRLTDQPLGGLRRCHSAS